MFMYVYSIEGTLSYKETHFLKGINIPHSFRYFLIVYYNVTLQPKVQVTQK